MTLVAAYRENGIPVLLGDFLLTADGQPSGLRKKIHLISSNLVVGWTGTLIAAIPVLKDLHSEFNGRHVSKDEFERFLKNYPPANFGSFSVLLIGWIIDGEQHCFWWNSERPVDLFYEPYVYFGTGGDRIKSGGN